HLGQLGQDLVGVHVLGQIEVFQPTRSVLGGMTDLPVQVGVDLVDKSTDLLGGLGRGGPAQLDGLGKGLADLGPVVPELGGGGRGIGGSATTEQSHGTIFAEAATTLTDRSGVPPGVASTPVVRIR